MQVRFFAGAAEAAGVEERHVAADGLNGHDLVALLGDGNEKLGRVLAVSSLLADGARVSDLAAPLGVSVPTITSWLDILELTGQVLLLPPYFENFGKRLVKSPKLYLADPGLACFLLGIESERQLDASPFLGPIFEGHVASEIVKSQLNQGKRRELYHFRDQKGLEVDFVVPGGEGRVTLVEAKATRTVRPDLARSLVALGAAAGGTRPPAAFVVHRGAAAGVASAALRPGVRSVPLSGLLAALR